MKTSKLIITLLISIFVPNYLTAQEYSFTCDTYNQKRECTYRNIPGSISLTKDDSNFPVLLAEVSNPEGKHTMPFCFFTDPDTSYNIIYMDTHEYDNTLRNVYDITDGEEDFIIAIKYENGVAQYIIMSYRHKTNPPLYIHIPYAATTYNNIQNIIKAAKRKIGFREM